MRVSMLWIILLVLLVLIALIAAGVIGVVKAGREDPERGNDMIRTVYLYLVLFATLMMTIGGTVAAFMAVADIVSPTVYYQSFEDYKQRPKEIVNEQEKNLTEDELRAKYEKMIAEEKQRSKDRAINSLIKSFGWIVIPFPVFLYYQRRLKNEPA